MESNGTYYVSNEYDSTGIENFKKEVESTVKFLAEDMPTMTEEDSKITLYGVSEEFCHIMACYEQAVYTI